MNKLLSYEDTKGIKRDTSEKKLKYYHQKLAASVG